jgi:6-phosphogluconate dehydrogenase
MARRLVEAGHEVIGCDREPSAIDRVREAGVKAVGDVAGLVEALPAPRVVWLMLPAGAVTGQVLDELVGLLALGDLVVDGGNSDWREAGIRGNNACPDAACCCRPALVRGVV